MAGVGARAERLALRPPMLPMTARSVAQLPNSGRWAYEPKFDGWRCLAFRQPGGKVVLQSRQQRWLTRQPFGELRSDTEGCVVLWRGRPAHSSVPATDAGPPPAHLERPV